MKNLKLTTICLSLLLFTMISQTLAQASDSETFKAGVSPGDNFLYTFNVFWKSPEPDQAAPASAMELNNTEWVKITVRETEGPIVTMNMTTRFKNETETNAQIWVNLYSGEGNGFGYIIAPNLKPNQLAYHMGSGLGKSFLLREEFAKSYPFGERTVLHALVNNTSSDEYVLISHDMYFDKETGVMLEWRTTQVPKNAPEANISLVWEIIEFHTSSKNISTDQNPSLQGILTLATLATIILLLIAILAYKRKKRLHRK